MVKEKILETGYLLLIMQEPLMKFTIKAKVETPTTLVALMSGKILI